MTLISLPCTLAELETAIHKYGDHHGFDVTVRAVEDRLGDCTLTDLVVETNDEKGED